jgi:hypothetical protein
VNIVHGNLPNGRIAHWRLLLEEHGPEHVHIKGKGSVAADDLSKMDLNDGSKPEAVKSMAVRCCLAHLEAGCSIGSSSDLGLCSAKDKEFEAFPLLPALIAREQLKDKT